MSKAITKAVLHQTEITLYNVQTVFATCGLTDELGGKPVWKLLYRLLRRFDLTLIPSGDLRRDPSFHTEALCDFAERNEKPLTKEQLVEYYLDVKARLFLQMDELDDETLAKGNSAFLERLLAELRRLSYEIGRIHTLTLLHTGKEPRFFDDDKNYPVDHRFFEEK